MANSMNIVEGPRRDPQGRSVSGPHYFELLYFELLAIFLTIASTSFRSLSFKLTE
jgi:hypothetical protein